MADWMDAVSFATPSPFAPKSRTSNAPSAFGSAGSHSAISSVRLSRSATVSPNAIVAATAAARIVPQGVLIFLRYR